MTLKVVHSALLILLLLSCSNKESFALDRETDACRTGYPEQATSDYILPYTPNSAFVVGQGNCTNGSHAINTDQAYAYDIDMPIGTNVVASKAGIVTVVVEHFHENNRTAGQANYLIIEHNDGTISGYYHLTKNGIFVELGDGVYQGDIIAQSGNTGDSSEPHLHFEVALCEDCETLPVNFKNTRKHKQGLVEGEAYKAK